MEIGIIGLPNVGKSSLFSLLTKISVPIEKFPFTTIQPNIGIVEVPDERFEFITSVLKPQKKVPPTIKFVDIAGLVKGASKGEGLGNRFLANIREVDAVVHVIRYFFDDTVSSSISRIEPVEEIDVINLELVLADIEVISKHIEKLQHRQKSGDRSVIEEIQFLEQLIELCNNYVNSKTLVAIREFVNKNRVRFQDKELQSFLNQLLITKNFLYVLNYDENVSRDDLEKKIEELTAYIDSSVLPLCIKFELSLLDFPNEEKESLRKEYGIPSSELKDFIKNSVKILHLITFYTVVGDEHRAWLIKENSSVLDAAEKIHTDIKEGFINAEVIPFEKFKQTPDIKLLHQNGEVKICGKDYIVQDGDIIKINFRTKT
jgi:GTP-binding protein YchF